MKLLNVVLAWSVVLTVAVMWQYETAKQAEINTPEVRYVRRKENNASVVIKTEDEQQDEQLDEQVIGGVEIHGLRGACGVMHTTDLDLFGWNLSTPKDEQVKVDVLPVGKLQMVPGLYGGDTISLKLCGTEQDMYVVYWGCAVVISPVVANPDFTSGASFKMHANKHHTGYFLLEASTFIGHFITERKGRLWMDPEDSAPDFRAKATWRLQVDTDPITLLNHKIPDDVTLPILLNPSECSVDHRGCCEAKSAKFDYPPYTSGPSTHTDITPIIISSINTIFTRLPLLESWLFPFIPSIWSQPVISLDAFTPYINTTAYNVKWIIGPLRKVRDLPLISIRVTTVMHWAFENRNSSWFFMVDDDTLVFAENLRWAVGHFPDPLSRFWYIGHSSEWGIKRWFHGNMAYGGGGVLISRKAADSWLSSFPGGHEQGSLEVHGSGKCSATGGDGSICRCLNLAAEPGAEIFTDFRGFHQFDIVGTKAMLDLVRGTCPKCSSSYDQIGLWADDVVGAYPVLTFHHVLAIPEGGLYPGMEGLATGVKLMTAYAAHPHYLMLRRVCAMTTPEAHTVCINFGHRVQVFNKKLHPDDAYTILELNNVSTSDRSYENLENIMVRDAYTNNLVCSYSYKEALAGEDESTNQYLYSSGPGPHAYHDAPCSGKVEVRVDVATFTYVADVQLNDVTYVATGSFKHLVLEK